MLRAWAEVAGLPTAVRGRGGVFRKVVVPGSTRGRGPVTEPGCLQPAYGGSRDLGPAGLPCPGSLVLCDAGGWLGSAFLLLWAMCAALQALGLCVGHESCPLLLPRLHWDTGNRVAASVQTSLGGVLGCPGSTCFSRLLASGLP